MIQRFLSPFDERSSAARAGPIRRKLLNPQASNYLHRNERQVRAYQEPRRRRRPWRYTQHNFRNNFREADVTPGNSMVQQVKRLHDEKRHVCVLRGQHFRFVGAISDA